MGKDGLEQIRGSSVMQEEDPLADSPQRCGPELVGTRRTLDYVVRQVRSHVMHQHIREQVDGPVLQNRAEHHRGGLHLKRMAQSASDALKYGSAPPGARARIRVG